MNSVVNESPYGVLDSDAEEHGGSVCLEESNREKTVFTLSLTKND
jgi:hypothetical protein